MGSNNNKNPSPLFHFTYNFPHLSYYHSQHLPHYTMSSTGFTEFIQPMTPPKLPSVPSVPNPTPTDDSISNINFMMALEKEFKISFALVEVQDLKNVGEMVQLIAKKTSGA